MGVGKTTAGEMLSSLTNKSFIDLDYEIEKASGLTVVNFFEERGESSFRSFESKLLKSFSRFKRTLSQLLNCFCLYIFRFW